MEICPGSLTNVGVEGGHYLAYLYKSVFTSREIRTKCGRNTQSWRLQGNESQAWWLQQFQSESQPVILLTPRQGYDSKGSFLP